MYAQYPIYAGRTGPYDDGQMTFQGFLFREATVDQGASQLHVWLKVVGIALLGYIAHGDGSIVLLGYNITIYYYIFFKCKSVCRRTKRPSASKPRQQYISNEGR